MGTCLAGTAPTRRLGSTVVASSAVGSFVTSYRLYIRGNPCPLSGTRQRCPLYGTVQLALTGARASLPTVSLNRGFLARRTPWCARFEAPLMDSGACAHLPHDPSVRQASTKAIVWQSLRSLRETEVLSGSFTPESSDRHKMETLSSSLAVEPQSTHSVRKSSSVLCSLPHCDTCKS